jgi:membrane fusion protein, multidrug efflux system
MNRSFALGGAALAVFLAAAGCSSKEGGGKAGNRPEGKPAVSIDAANVATGEVAEGIEVTGTLSPKYQAEMKSEYGGVVAQVYVNDWAKVRKGDPLLKVDTREGEVLLLKAKAALEMAKAGRLEAEAAVTRADREYDRAVKLLESGLITRQGMDDTRTQKEAAAARVAAAKAQVAAAGEDVAQVTTRLSKAVIRSPFDGTVAERLVSVGDLVGEMQKVVFRLVDNRLLELTVSVPSTEMAALRVGQPVRFSTDAFPGREFEGTVAHINPSVSPGDRSVRVIAEVPNVPEVLKGGLFVKGRIATGRRMGVLQVPRAALLSWNVAARKGEVFVVDNNVARRRGVTTGAVQGERVEISSGLRSGETVVTRGAYLLSDGDAVKVAAAGK